MNARLSKKKTLKALLVKAFLHLLSTVHPQCTATGSRARINTIVHVVWNDRSQALTISMFGSKLFSTFFQKFVKQVRTVLWNFEHCRHCFVNWFIWLVRQTQEYFTETTAVSFMMVRNRAGPEGNSQPFDFSLFHSVTLYLGYFLSALRVCVKRRFGNWPCYKQPWAHVLVDCWFMNVCFEVQIYCIIA